MRILAWVCVCVRYNVVASPPTESKKNLACQKSRPISKVQCRIMAVQCVRTHKPSNLDVCVCEHSRRHQIGDAKQNGAHVALPRMKCVTRDYLFSICIYMYGRAVWRSRERELSLNPLTPPERLGDWGTTQRFATNDYMSCAHLENCIDYKYLYRQTKCFSYF